MGLFSGITPKEYTDIKAHSLINIGTVIYSTRMQKYFYDFDNSMAIQQWIRDNKDCSRKAVLIGDKIRSQLTCLLSQITAPNVSIQQTINVNNCNDQNHVAQSLLNNNNNNNNNMNINNLIQTPIMYNNISSFNLMNTQLTPAAVTLPINGLNGLNVLPFIPTYGGLHTNTYSVSGMFRYLIYVYTCTYLYVLRIYKKTDTRYSPFATLTFTPFYNAYINPVVPVQTRNNPTQNRVYNANINTQNVLSNIFLNPYQFM